jgi:hypothetical protein
MSYFLKRTVVLFLSLGVAACGQSDNKDGHVTSESSASSLSAARYSGEMSKEGCEFLTAQLVSSVFNVPADALKKTNIQGCIYNWASGNETLQAGILMIRVHKSDEDAARWFAGITTSKTAEEVQAELDSAAGQLDKQKELDTEIKKSTAKNLLAMVKAKAVNYEDVAGLGDEARVSDEGTVYVRVDNLTFRVTAYKGPEAPPPDMKGVEIKQMAAVAQENTARWATETAPQRREDSTRLARAIVAEM